MNDPANKYLYQGIELQDELGFDVYSFEQRSYDAALGRWWQIDPKASERESPYVGMANNPILYSDPLGDTVIILYKAIDVAPDFYHTAIIFKNNETGEEKVMVEGFPEIGPTPNPRGDEETGETWWGELIRSEENEASDIPQEDKEAVDVPEGMTEEGFRQEILDNAKTYDNSVEYFPVPELIGGTGNSNSLIGSVLRASGSNFKPSRIAPGFGRDVLPAQRRSRRPVSRFRPLGNIR